MPAPSTIITLIHQITQGTLWSRWYSLNRSERVKGEGSDLLEDPLPVSGGIYRVRAQGDVILSYIGQTNNFRRRAHELQNVFAPVMPWTSPHVASPALWAWCQDWPGTVLEISVAPFASSAYWREGLEEFALALERWNYGCSPRWNYGRIPRGWRPSSRPGGQRGGAIPLEVELPCHQAGIVPITDLFEQSEPLGPNFGRHVWSEWRSVHEVKENRTTQGLYRLRRGEQLEYIGHGLITDTAREAKRYNPDLTFSFVPGTWREHEMRELCTDLIALYLRQTLSLPCTQYGGEDGVVQLPQIQDTAPWIRLFIRRVAASRAGTRLAAG